MLPFGHEPDLLWPGRRDDRAAVISPEMASGHAGGVACVTNHDSRVYVHELFELEHVALVGGREVDGSQSALVVNGCM